jgi:DNA-binding CsgD family transcriptional regulator/PAS domain-containing protein
MPLPDIGEFSCIVGDIYDCAFDQSLWSGALTRISTALNAAYATVSVSDPKFTNPRMAAHSPWDPAWLKSLNEDFGVDGVPGLKQVAFGDVDIAHSTMNQMSEADFQQSAFYRNWVAPQGLRDACVMKFVHTADRIGVMAVVTRATRGIVTADERQLMSLMAPHIRRASLIGDLLNYARVEASQYRTALDALSTSVFFVDCDGRVHYANQSAEALLRDGAHITVAAGRLMPSDPAVRAALADTLLRTRSSDPELGGRGIGIPLAGSDRAPTVAYVLPLMASVAQSLYRPATAAVFISNQVSVPPPSSVLETLYDLTPAEARVMLHISAGKSIADVSDTLGLSQNTVKTHLSRVYGKSGTNKQSDLVKLVLSLAPPQILTPKQQGCS